MVCMGSGAIISRQFQYYPNAGDYDVRLNESALLC